MRIPTTEFCPTCAAETPADLLKRAGRIQNRVFQDLDSGEYICVVGHKVDLGPVAEIPEPPTAAIEAPERRPSATQPAHQTSVAVEEMPQTSQAQVVPGSSRMRQGGALEVTLVVPEQYVGPLSEYCAGIGKSVEEHINEVVANGFENGWFV